MLRRRAQNSPTVTSSWRLSTQRHVYPEGSWSTTGTLQLLLLCPPHPSHTHPIPTLGDSGKEKGAKVEDYILRSLLSGHLLIEAFPNRPFFLNTHSSSLYPRRFILVLVFRVSWIYSIYAFTYELSLYITWMQVPEDKDLVYLAYGWTLSIWFNKYVISK